MTRREVLKGVNGVAEVVKKGTTSTVRVTRSTRSTTRSVTTSSSVTVDEITDVKDGEDLIKLTKTKAKKVTKKPKRTMYEDSVQHIEILPKYELPKSFVDYHSTELIDGIKHILTIDPSLYRTIVSSNFERYKKLAAKKESKSESETVRSYWLSLMSSVMAQQISGSAAAAIYGRFESSFQEEPNPKELLTFSTEQLRELGLSYQKVKYVIHISEVFSDPSENLAKLKFYEDATLDELTEELVKLKGIGEWSAKMFICFTLKKLDVFAHDDLGVARGAAYYLSKRPEMVKQMKEATHRNEESKVLLKKKGKFDKPSSKRDWVPYHDEYVKQLAKPFGPYRSLFMLLLWRLSSTNVQVLEEEK